MPMGQAFCAVALCSGRVNGAVTTIEVVVSDIVGHIDASMEVDQPKTF
jgi:hypothetical protein